jgi:multidrug efflux pump subunit AcrA (membrane-fusion protein)
MKSLKLVLATTGAVVFAAGCAPLAVPGSSTGSQTQSINVPAAAAQRGDIQQTLSFSGDVRARDQITVLPKATGRVQNVLVDLGSSVHAGDVVAELEQDSPEIAVLQARANLAAAQAKLATIQAGARPDDVAVAEEALAQQQAHLEAMQAQGRPEDTAAAQSGLAAQNAKLNLLLSGGRTEAVGQAQAAVDAAQQKLALLQKGATDDVRQAAASAVSADVAQVTATEAAYAALGGTSSADLQQLQNQVDALQAQVNAAQTAVSSANTALDAQTGSSAADIQAAQTAFDQAQAQLTAAQAALNQAQNPTQASLAQAQAALTAAQAQHAAAEANQTALEQNVGGACAPIPAGQRVNEQMGASITGTISTFTVPANGAACGEAKNAADAAVQAGNAAVEAAQGQLDQLRRGGAPASLAATQAQTASAQALVKATKARLDALTNGGVQAQRAQLQAVHDQSVSQMTQAQDNLNVAQARLQAAQNGTLDAQRKAAQAQVDASREKLKSDQAKLEQISAGPQDEEVQAAQDAVTQAEQQLALATQPATAQDVEAQRALVNQAQLQLQKAQLPYTSFDIQQQEHVVAQAEAQLRARQNPYTDQDVQAAQAGVDQAQAALEMAQLGVRETQVVAPVDGIVFDRQVSPGALVGPTSPIVTLIPPALEVAINVEEAQLGNVWQGQHVALQVPAYPDQTFNGTVTAVAPAVDQKTRTASVRIQPQDDASRLKPGMLAQVSIITATQSDALLVPREAVVGTPAANSSATLITLDGGHAQRTTVQLGLVGDRLVQINSGLSDGQVVAIGNANGLNTGDAVVPQLRSTLAATGVQQ